MACYVTQITAICYTQLSRDHVTQSGYDSRGSVGGHGHIVQLGSLQGFLPNIQDSRSGNGECEIL